MTDQRAAEAAGLHPNNAAYIKSKPSVRAYMLEHRALAEQQHAAQQAESVRRLNLDREQVLARLWEIANLSPEMTRGSVTAQVKALSMIVAIEGLIPNPRGDSEHKPAPAPPVQAKNLYRRLATRTAGATTRTNPGEEELATPQAEPAEHAPLHPGPDSNRDYPVNPGESTFAHRSGLSGLQWEPGEPLALDTRLPLSIENSRFGDPLR